MEILLAAFGGGVFGALIGALPAFIFTGVLGLVGIAVLLTTGNGVIVSEVAFGSLFGPHIAFAGGVAAAAYAAKVEKLKTGMDVLTPLAALNDPVVILIGGVFGVLGHIINNFYASIGLQTDTIAMTVVTSGIIARILFGSSGLINKKMKEKSMFGDRKAFITSILGALGIGMVISYLVDVTQVNILGFCVSAALLIFAQMGFGIPTTHHISLVAGYATIATGSIYVGIIFAILAQIIFNAAAYVFNTEVDTHIDPPAASIFICSFIIFIFLG